MILKEIINKFDKSSIKAGEGLEKGQFPLYTCSPLVNKFLDDYICDEEAIIISTGGNFAVHYVNGKFNYSTDCYVFNTDKLNLKYLYYYLISKTDDINKLFRGAGLKHLNKNEFLLMNVDSIDIQKQKRIVDHLDKISNLIELRKKQVNKCDNLIKSQFVGMFEKQDYNTNKLESVCTKITDGTHKTPKYQDYGIAFISAKNIINEKIDFSDIKYIDEKEYEDIQRRCAIEKGDILLSKSGSLGIPAILEADFPVGLFESLAVIKYKKEIMNGIFLCEQLKNDSIQKQFKSGTKGVAIKHLHLNVLKNINILVPPIELQNQFANIVEQIDKQKFEFEKSLKKLEEMQAALMQEYFG